MDIPQTKTDAIKLFGGRTKLAKALGTSKQALGSWRELLTDAAKKRIKLALLEIGEK